MRIELQHKTNCPSSKELRHVLEDIIAEERLPLAVEMVESNDNETPTVRIHISSSADLVQSRKELSFDKTICAETQFLEKLRDVVLQSWSDHAIAPLSHFNSSTG